MFSEIPGWFLRQLLGKSPKWATCAPMRWEGCYLSPWGCIPGSSLPGSTRPCYLFNQDHRSSQQQHSSYSSSVIDTVKTLVDVTSEVGMTEVKKAKSCKNVCEISMRTHYEYLKFGRVILLSNKEEWIWELVCEKHNFPLKNAIFLQIWINSGP